MDSKIALLDKLREERIAREKARIEKLRQINLQKYNCTNEQSRNLNYSVKEGAKPVKSETNVKKSSTGPVKNNFHVNGTSKRPVSAPSTKVDTAYIAPKNNIPLNQDSKPGSSNITMTAGVKMIMSVNESNKTNGSRNFKTTGNFNKTQTKSENHSNVASKEFKTNNLKQIPKRMTISASNTKALDVAINAPSSIPMKQEPTPKCSNVSVNVTNKFISGNCKSSSNINKMQNKNEKLLNVTTKEDISKKCSNNKPTSNNQSKLTNTNNMKREIPKVILNKSANLRKSMAVERPKVVAPTRKSVYQTSNQSVFERLYNPKSKPKVEMNKVEKLHNDPNYLKKIIKRTGLIINTHHTMEYGPKIVIPVRRSISAVHFKRISKNELGNCIHKWSSVSSNLNKSHMKHINEDETIADDKVVSAIKSERKKVKFMTPMSNFNTPKPEELQLRLKTWLQKQGKSLDSYHHLQCFGIQHLPQQLKFDTKLYDDEDKENIELDSDSDDGSYTENMNEVESNTWRTADSYISDSVDCNESANTTLTSEAVNANDLLLGALNDLTELLKEGFSWEQCARWLRAIREQFPSASQSSAYWECRAALEERRGNLPASVECWEEAIAKGTEHSVVEASLDQLLDKFMQLKISPNSGKRRDVNPKLVDVKNVFKSTIIRFALQQAKLRQSAQFEGPHFTVTPVRRSARLSTHWSANRTPLQEYSTFRQADKITEGRSLFVPNLNLCETP